MHLLIVHGDPEMGEALVQMVKSYTRHPCQLISTESAVMETAQKDEAGSQRQSA
jgi:hypothetical protein